MTPSEYRYQIEKIYSESLSIFDWLISNDQFKDFVLMAKTAGTGSLVLDNWKIYLDGGGDSDDFYDWWSENRPDKMDSQELAKVEEVKKSPFAAVKKKVRMK